MHRLKQVKAYDLTKLGRYRGKWVALSPKRGNVVGSGVTPGQAVRQAQKRGVENPVLVGSPKSSGAYILAWLG